MFTLTIETDNAAFERNPKHEIRRLLADVRARLKSDVTEGILRDVNGNTVGRYELTP